MCLNYKEYRPSKGNIKGPKNLRYIPYLRGIGLSGLVLGCWPVYYSLQLYDFGLSVAATIPVVPGRRFVTA